MNTVVFLITLSGGSTFGIYKSEWVAFRSDGGMATIEAAPHAFLPLLEITEEAINVLVRERSRDLALRAIPSFPHRELILAGLRSCSAYWEELAVARLRVRVDLSSFGEALVHMMRKGSTQALRQEAKQLLKRSNPPE